MDTKRLDGLDEPILEPDLPIVDPHHHLWDQPDHRYMLEDLLADTGSGHAITETVYIEARAFYTPDAAPGMEFVGEVEFVNGVAAMAATGRYGPTKVAAGIVGTADLTRGAAVEELLATEIARGGPRFKGIRRFLFQKPGKADDGLHYAK